MEILVALTLAIAMMGIVSSRQQHVREERTASRFVQDIRLVEDSPISKREKQLLRSRLWMKWQWTRPTKREYSSYPLSEYEADKKMVLPFEESIHVRMHHTGRVSQSEHRYFSMQPFSTSLFLGWPVLMSTFFIGFGLMLSDIPFVSQKWMGASIVLLSTAGLLGATHVAFLRAFPKETTRPLLLEDIFFPSEIEMLEKTDSLYRSEGMRIQSLLKTPLLVLSEETALFLTACIETLREMQDEAMAMDRKRRTEGQTGWLNDVCRLPDRRYIHSSETKETAERRKDWLRRLVKAMNDFEEHFEDLHAVFFGERRLDDVVAEAFVVNHPPALKTGDAVRRALLLKEEIQTVVDKGISDTALSELAEKTLAEAEQRYQEEITREESLRAQWKKEDDMATLQAVKDYLRIT